MSSEGISEDVRRQESELSSASAEKKDGNGSKRKRYGQLSQSRSAILCTVVILFIVDLLAVLFTVLPGDTPETRVFPTDFQLIFSAVIDLFLGINLLRGRTWARTWMLIRSVGGIFLWGAVLVIQRDFSGLILNTGVLLALILLLTGVSTRLRLAGSITVAVVATIVGTLWSVMGSFTTLPTVPEKLTPINFSTYTSEGFFSISYPPDWEPVMSVIEELEKEIKQYGKNLGLESQVNEMQVVFSAGKKTEKGDTLLVMVMVQPRSLWPLDIMVEAANQWSKENLEQYVEYSRVRTTIGGKEAIISTTQLRDVDSVLMKYTTSFVLGDKFMWSVLSGCNSQGFDAHYDTFDSIVRSLRVEY